jgi:hypothetical protein
MILKLKNFLVQLKVLFGFFQFSSDSEFLVFVVYGSAKCVHSRKLCLWEKCAPDL